jgi:RNA polymerase sigma-70 factor (ECF subfamily)
MSSILAAYLENEAALKRFLRRFLGRVLSRDMVDDLAQETFLRAYAAEALEDIASPRAFLFKVARNLVLNERAKLSNATTEPLEDFAGAAVLEDSSRSSVDDQIAARQQARALAAAIAGLPPQCARVFVLRKVHGLSYQEIAQRLNISVSTAEKHVALGLLRCTDQLRRQGYEIGGKKSAQDQSSQVSYLGVRRKDLSGDG